MTSLFFGSKKKEEKVKDPKDVKKDAPPAGKDAAPNQDLSKVKVSAKDSLKETPKDKKEKTEKKDKKDKEKDKHKPHEEGMPDEATLNSLFMALLVHLSPP